jgi:hypothetical protein
MLGIKDDPIAIYLDFHAYGALGAFLLTIALGIGFHYASAKWVKQAWGQPVRFFANRLESIMDFLFWLTILAFVGGLAMFGAFVFDA